MVYLVLDMVFFKTISLFFLFFFIITQFPVLKDSQNAHLQNVLARLDTFAKVHTAPNSTFIFYFQNLH